MALDATVGGASANSYLTIAEADAYADQDLGENGQKWIAATLLRKERALLKATSQVDAFVRLAPEGLQALAFPREGEIVLPARIRRATYYQAAYLNANAELLDQAASRRARGLVSFSNPDSTAGAPSLDPQFGRYAPEFEAELGALRTSSTVMSVPLRTPYYRRSDDLPLP